MSFNPPPFTLRQLAYLVRAADEGSIAAASRQMHVSPSTMSDAITELERLLGAKLSVRRRSQGFALTNVGKHVVQAARPLLRGADELYTSIHMSWDELAGPLSVGTFPTIAPSVFPPILTDFQARHPRVQVDILEAPHDELFERLESGRLDLAIVNDTYLPGRLLRSKLFEMTTYLLLPAAHRLADAPTVRLEDLVEDDFIMLDVPPSTEHQLSHFARRGLSVRARYRVGTAELVRRLVAQGLGYGLLIHRDHTPEQLAELGLVQKEISPAIPPIGTYLVWQADGFPSARAEALAEFLKQLPLPLGAQRG